MDLLTIKDVDTAGKIEALKSQIWINAARIYRENSWGGEHRADAGPS